MKAEKESPKDPKFQSIVRRVVIWPMILMTIVVCIVKSEFRCKLPLGTPGCCLGNAQFP